MIQVHIPLVKAPTNQLVIHVQLIQTLDQVLIIQLLTIYIPLIQALQYNRHTEPYNTNSYEHPTYRATNITIIYPTHLDPYNTINCKQTSTIEKHSYPLHFHSSRPLQ